MSSHSLSFTDDLYGYFHSVSLRETDLMRRLREETRRDPEATMQISPEQGQLFMLLIELIGAKRTLELGVFTGYSSLCVALALPPDGRVIACDINEHWTSVARRYWKEAGVADKIDLRLAPAQETLDLLLADGQAGAFDFAFIDADKENYDVYYERCLQLVKPGGLIAVDNVLWSGRVADLGDQEPSTRSLRALNEKLHRDRRITLSMVPIGDGLTLARRRP